MPKEAPDKSQSLYGLAVDMMIASQKPFEAETLEQIVKAISIEIRLGISEIPGAIERRHDSLTVTARCIADVMAGICNKRPEPPDESIPIKAQPN